MIVAELITLTKLNPSFHRAIEQIAGFNPAERLQRGKRPRSEHAYPLAYFKLFANESADTQQVRDMFGFFHFGILCAGNELDIAEITGWPHGLRCLQRLCNRGGAAVIMSGDGEQWATAIKNAPSGTPAIQEWGRVCYNQFARLSLEDLLGKLRPQGETYYLEG